MAEKELSYNQTFRLFLRIILCVISIGRDPLQTVSSTLLSFYHSTMVLLVIYYYFQLGRSFMTFLS